MELNEIIQANTVIHDWRGIKRMRPPFERWWVGSEKPEELKYHFAWEWLMVIVDKIETLPADDFHGHFVVYISSNGCTILGTKLRTGPKNYHPAYFNDVIAETKILSTWLACVSFIKWFNQKDK